uniref:NADH-ubiquinone oxidoreductase chain 3 n=1 Tax=Tituria pyramidata TaxID=2713555 RepID=A0A6G6D491_9HEMI|nr:NADH dehydrogenase subunit 3 [Tituria pyramidata]QIE11349.1 NADH dehydrogenase subunit 3 [Tituria pyramidata]
MYMVFMYFLVVFMVLLLMFFFSFFFSKKSVCDYQSSSSFECGFNSMSSKRLPFSIHFFLVAVIFLIFDIEVAIIFPIVIVLKYSQVYMWFYVISFFIFVLIIGLYHEWYNGILNWTC